MGSRPYVASKWTIKRARRHTLSSTVFASCIVVQVAGCASVQPPTCPAGFELNAAGTECVSIQCEGGVINDGRCVCPDGTDLVAGSCTSSECIGVECGDGNECTTDSCTEGVCANAIVSDGTACEGGAGMCAGGNCVECTQSGEQCSDANECTNDVCTDGICSNPNSDGGSCDLMPGDGVCMGGGCEEVPLSCQGETCDDGKDCTQNICMDVGGIGTCSNPAEPDGSPCADDGNECTTNSCAAGTCAAAPVSDGTMCNGGADECEAGVCVERKWGTPQLIEADNPHGAFNPQLAFDPSGNALAVWHQSAGMRNDIWANRYTPSGGWGTAERIETDDSGGAGGHQLAIDQSGNALAVWSQWDGTRTNIWSNRYTPSGGWSTAQLIEANDAGNAVDPQVAIDASGNALTVWYESDSTRDNIWANRYTPSGGWGTAGLIETDNAGDALNPQLAIDPSGKALAVWSQSDGTRNNIWANRYTPIVAWVAAESIETDNAGGAIDPQVAIDRSGNALAVWSQSDGTRENVWANRYTPSRGWATAEPIEVDNSGDALNPQVAIDASGNALAVWWQFDGIRNSIWANRHTPSGGWGTAERIEDDDAGNAFRPQVAIDPGGNALAVWSQSDGARENVWANRYTPSGGWGTAEPIENDDAGTAFTPQVAIDPSGNAIAVWSQSDGIRDRIWANRFE